MCPHGYLFEEWYGPYLENNGWARWTMRLLSYVTMVTGCLEQLQICAMFIAFIPTIILSWERIENLTSQLPTTTETQFSNAVINYRELHVLGKIGRDFVMSVMLQMLWTYSFVCSGFTYVTIRLYGTMPTIIYLLAPYTCLVVFCVAYFLLRGLEGVNKKCVEGLANLKLCRIRRSLERRVINSIPVSAIQCGLLGYKIFQIEDGYKLEFFASVIDNTWNLLLSFPNA